MNSALTLRRRTVALCDPRSYGAAQTIYLALARLLLPFPMCVRCCLCLPSRLSHSQAGHRYCHHRHPLQLRLEASRFHLFVPFFLSFPSSATPCFFFGLSALLGSWNPLGRILDSSISLFWYRLSRGHQGHILFPSLAHFQPQASTTPRETRSEQHQSTRLLSANTQLIIVRLTGICGIVASTPCVIAYEGSAISNTVLAQIPGPETPSDSPTHPITRSTQGQKSRRTRKIRQVRPVMPCDYHVTFPIASWEACLLSREATRTPPRLGLWLFAPVVASHSSL